MSEQQSGLAKSEVTHRENGPEEDCNASVCISSREAAASTPCGELYHFLRVIAAVLCSLLTF